jgi:bifunctional DNase/RNase
MNKKKIKLNIVGLSFTQTNSMAYALILSEEDGKRRIPVIIGGLEAQSISIKLEKLQPPRPLTHDLFMNFAKIFLIDLNEVIIYKVEDGVFYSYLIFKKDNKTVSIDARTSDAIAIAIRFNCPIYTYEEIINKAGVVFEEITQIKTEAEKNINSLNSTLATLKELKIMLKDAIDSENYEMASIIREEKKQKT